MQLFSARGSSWYQVPGTVYLDPSIYQLPRTPGTRAPDVACAATTGTYDKVGYQIQGTGGT